jgi:UDP-3-O-[3-hydroxymyristoyl] N-acetylglucosamine deacetylase
MLARALLEQGESWEIATFEEAASAPSGVTRWLEQVA